MGAFTPPFIKSGASCSGYCPIIVVQVTTKKPTVLAFRMELVSPALITHVLYAPIVFIFKNIPGYRPPPVQLAFICQLITSCSLLAFDSLADFIRVCLPQKVANTVS